MRPAQYALNEYRQTSVEASTQYADPHTLIAMLYDGLQERMAVAKGAIARGAYADKGRVLGNAIDMIGYLQACLDLNAGGELAANLNALYTYMTARLVQAGRENNPVLLDEISNLVRTLQSGWSGIRDQVHPK